MADEPSGKNPNESARHAAILWLCHRAVIPKPHAHPSGPVLLTATAAAHAGTELLGFVNDSKSEQSVIQWSPADKGRIEVEVGAGAFGSLNTNGSATRPDTGFVLGQLRFGMMLYSPAGPGILRGNLEAMVEVYGAGIYTGPGDRSTARASSCATTSCNRSSRIVPFAQVMFGGAYSDAADDDPVQRLMGREFLFSFGGEIGLRCMLTERMSLIGGIEYRHLSNANTADRNVGLNVLGGTIGLSWFY